MIIISENDQWLVELVKAYLHLELVEEQLVVAIDEAFYDYHKDRKRKLSMEDKRSLDYVHMVREQITKHYIAMKSELSKCLERREAVASLRELDSPEITNKLLACLEE
jgi:hypothetical protein